MKLENKVAVVTGAGRGIGRGIALALAEEGAKVVVADIGEEREDVASEIEEKGSTAFPIKVDVTSIEDAEKMAEAAVDKFGRIDILVNNAGIYPFKQLAEMKDEDFDQVINVNLKGVYNCTKAVLPKMLEEEIGNIVNIASIDAIVGTPSLAHYCASKAGVAGFTRAAATELAPKGIRVNAVGPGFIETPGTEEFASEEIKEKVVQKIPLGRIGKPKDIADVVVFLASDMSKYITGQLIVADGGMTIQFAL